jgi:hypothetical protein
MKNLRALIKEILNEEVSPRSQKTTLPPDDLMHSWRKTPGIISCLIAADPAREGGGVFRVEIELEDKSKKEGKFKVSGVFADETSANHFAKTEVEKYARQKMADENYPVNSLQY